MNKIKFVPADFKWGAVTKIPLVEAAHLANRRLAEMLSEHAIVVYGAMGYQGREWSTLQRSDKGRTLIPSNFINDTHRALLINVEEIEKKVCEHKPEVNAFNLFRCEHCKVPIKPKWEAVSE